MLVAAAARTISTARLPHQPDFEPPFLGGIRDATPTRG
jgi:hypothetical protein